MCSSDLTGPSAAGAGQGAGRHGLSGFGGESCRDGCRIGNLGEDLAPVGQAGPVGVGPHDVLGDADDVAHGDEAVVGVVLVVPGVRGVGAIVPP